MSHNFSFFVTPSELQDCLNKVSSRTGATLWVFPEAMSRGPVSEVANLEMAPKRVLWFGAMPRRVSNWDTRSAALEAGFVAVVRPVIDEANRNLFLGELFAPPDAVKLPHSLFRAVKAVVSAILKVELVAVRDDDASARSKRGPRASDGAMRLFRIEYRLRMFEAPLLHYEPKSATQGLNNPRPSGAQAP